MKILCFARYTGQTERIEQEERITKDRDIDLPRCPGLSVSVVIAVGSRPMVFLQKLAPTYDLAYYILLC